MDVEVEGKECGATCADEDRICCWESIPLLHRKSLFQEELDGSRDCDFMVECGNVSPTTWSILAVLLDVKTEAVSVNENLLAIVSVGSCCGFTVTLISSGIDSTTTPRHTVVLTDCCIRGTRLFKSSFDILLKPSGAYGLMYGTGFDFSSLITLKFLSSGKFCRSKIEVDVVGAFEVFDRPLVLL
jgi:hypothetical protein